jgi:hypothetical protein
MTININCIILGNFSDLLNLEVYSRIRIRNQLIIGEIAKTGKYKGKNAPYSSADLVLENNNDLDEFLKEFKLIYPYLKEMEVFQILLTLNFQYENQCNWEFSNEQLMRIVEMGIQLSFSCYKA